MNKLEEQLFEAFNNPEAYSLHGKPGFALEEHYARIAARICLEVAWEQYRVGRAEAGMRVIKGFEDFKQEIL